MENRDKLIFLLFFLIVLILIYTLYNIYKFMPVLASCEDDFAVISKCGYVPCSWKDEGLYNNKFTCVNGSIDIGEK